MLSSTLNPLKLLRNISAPFCFILMVAMPALPAPITSVVRADIKTGKLIRSVIAPPVAVAEVSSEELDTLIDKIAAEQGVETHLVHSVIKAESNYHASAISPKGAQGLMQLIPSTAKRFGVANSFDPKENIEGGVKYLKFLLDYYNQDISKAVAAYNAGEKAVDKFHGIPPYAETQNYVVQVTKNLNARRAKPTKATAAPVQMASNETPHPIVASVGSDGRLYYSTP
jgi:soluble lytic murein transglycosylase-like protein